MKLKIWAVGVVLALAASAAESGMELYQKAVTQERAGKMDEAIRLYEKVAHDFASDRALAAKALVAAARDYEKLGQDKQDQAIKLYEQIANDFADQRDLASAARAKLAKLRPPAPPVPATMTARRLEGSPYTDSLRSLSFNPTTNELIMTDLATKKTRVVYKHKPGAILGSLDEALGGGLTQRLSFYPSRDLSAILLEERLTYKVPYPAVAVIQSDGSGYRRIGRLSATGALEGFNWSWDNRYVLFIGRQPDGSSRLGRLTVADGHIQEILRRENAVIRAASFSPDGRFIAFAEGAANSNAANSSKVFILPAQGGEPRVVSADATLLDWTRDGGYLVVNSGPPGSRALYLLPVKDGQAAGDPVSLRAGSVESGRTTASGALLYTSASSSTAVYLGKLGPNGHVDTWEPLNLPGTNEFPDWSPNDTHIAYSSYSREGDRTLVLHVRDLATGADRELYRRSDTNRLLCHWAAQHFRISCTANLGPVSEVVSIDADTGKTEQLASLTGSGWAMWWPTPDDSGFYMYNVGNGRNGMVRWDIATHEATPMGEGINISPDGRFLWTGGKPDEPQSDPALRMTLQIRPSSSPEWKRVGYFRMDPWTGPGQLHVNFSYDGNWLYFHSRDEAGKDGLYRASTSAVTQVERLGDFPSHIIQGTLAISRDGRKFIAVALDAVQGERWLLENFIPKAKRAR